MVSAEHLVERWNGLKTERATLDSHWQEISELMSPMRGDFTVQREMGEKRTANVFDSTAMNAANNLAAGLYGMISSPADDWFEMRALDDDLAQRHEVKLWFGEVTRLMRDQFASRGNRFYSRVIDLYRDLAIYGTAVFYCEEIPESAAIRFSCRPLNECWIAENEREEVDTLYRLWQPNARQAYQRFGALGGEKLAKMNAEEPARKLQFLHAVYPNHDFKKDRVGPNGKNFRSCWVSVEERRIVAESGYHEFPYQVPRWSRSAAGLYGDSPAMIALADVKMLNAMSKTTIVSAQKQVDPALLTNDEDILSGKRIPLVGGIIYNGLDENGRRRYEPLVTNGQVNLGLELENQRRQTIGDAFHSQLMMMVQKTHITATEVMARQEEKLRLMGPNLGRVQAEFLDPLLTRVFRIMARQGAFPPMPDILADGAEIGIDYVSPLARAQKASQGSAVIRVLESLMPLSQIDSSVFDNLDLDAASRVLVESWAVPPTILRDPRDIAKMREARAQAMQQQQQMAAIPPAAAAARDAAMAGKISAEAEAEAA